MSVVVMTNEKFREGVPPWEVQYCLANKIKFTKLDYETEISIYRYMKQLFYELKISSHDSWQGNGPSQLSHMNRNKEQIIQLLV